MPAAMCMPVNLITLPQEILERVARVLEYHESTKHTYQSARAEPINLDPATQPYEFRVFEMRPKIPLPSGLLDLPGATISLMANGLDALAPSQVGPPQDLKTLATWLHYSNSIANKRRTVTQTVFTRTCASDSNTFPSEMYVAAFAVEGLEPGLYHYTPREFALRKLRDGSETLARLTRGRPDLAFLKTVPAAMLVSSIFCRSTWRFGKRGYRHALHDVGYLVQNLVTVATGLGITTMTRLHVNDTATRDLIGIEMDAEFNQAEAVHAMVVWADRATCPMERPAVAAAIAPAEPSVATSANAPQSASPLAGMTLSGPTGARMTDASPVAKAPTGGATLPLIERTELAAEVTPYVSILSTHIDCVAPGIALREIRPPLTDSNPLPANIPVHRAPTPEQQPAGQPLRNVLFTRQPSPHFGARGIQRDAFIAINRMAFRGGTFFPLHPDGPHVALVRPFWLIHDVVGLDAGIWYYNPPTDEWAILRHGNFRREAFYLAMEQQAFGQSAATCFLTANLRYLMSVTGPDIYRLAFLEAGICTNRLALSSEALDLAWFESGLFYDEEVRTFLGLGQSGWEILCEIAVGTRSAGEKHNGSTTGVALG
jgi:SagB-type dehydrogenase family enzyme